MAGLDKDKTALPLATRSSRYVPLFPTAESALQTRIGGYKSDRDPGTPAGWFVSGLRGPFESCDKAIPQFSQATTPLVPFPLDKWFDRASTVSSAEPLTTPRKIEGPNLNGLPCCKGREQVQRASWHK